MLNPSNEDLTVPQHFALLEKYGTAFQLSMDVLLKPDPSGALGKRTETGVSIEETIKNRFTGMDAILGDEMRLETREQYSNRLNQIKSDLLNHITNGAKYGLTTADKNALERMAVASGLTLDAPTKDASVDQISNARPKGAEEFKKGDQSGK